MKPYLLAALVLVSCNRKATTEITTSTRDSIATVTLPTRSTSIISEPCDSNGMPRKWEVEYTIANTKVNVKSDEKGISVTADSKGDTSSKVSKSETSKSESVKTIYKTSQFDWWLRIIAAVYIVWLVARKRIFNILNNG